MKRCESCGQIVAQQITTCPACGSRLVAGMTSVDDYRIQHIIHEGRSSLVCRAIKEGHKKPVTIRLFTDQSGVDKAIAQRLEKELETLAKLPEELFVQHYAIRQSNTGHWYRVSEWVDAENWGSIFVSGILNDQRRMVTLFYNIASALNLLHQHDHFMPYLILDDILLPKKRTRNLSVKINYKLSRFLNARATHHGPMLKKLLEHHPDIVNDRAIDFRTGIWSLGKIFIELLTADHNLTDFSAKVDQLEGLDPELAVLIKVMLSDDPDLRPQSMAKVASTLARILERLPSKSIYAATYKKKPKLIKEITWFKRMVMVMLVLIIGIVSANTFVYFNREPEQGDAGFTRILESHTRSIGFLMVEYWLAHKDQVIYKNKVEGTAFLVDEQGYMLTNRHVACPWLEDPALFQIRNRLKETELEFGHRMYLWFEGTKAFNRLQGLGQSTDLADDYYLEGAFRSTGKSNLRVVGVPRGLRQAGDRLHLPFQHDFAVLKIDTLPEDILPLPLETRQDPRDIRRLSPVIIMGFPLGSRTQDERINPSITRGHVRRTSKELIQVDSSIYKGNSGGPAVNAQGRVIGIASGVITDQPSGQIPLRTPLSDFGLVLPISRPADFVESLKAGKPKWNGLLDFTLEKKLDQVLSLANAHDYKGAAALARALLKNSQDPALVFTTALLDFCNGNLGASRKLFTRLISIEGENMVARLMLFIIDWLNDEDQSRSLTRDLFSVSWQHPDEFSGYLARVLKAGRRMDPGYVEYENQAEKAWRSFVEGLILEKNNDFARALGAYKGVVMTAGANDHLYFMAFSRLNRLLDKKQAFAEDREEHSRSQQALWDQALKNRTTAKEEYNKAVALIQEFESPATSHEKKVSAYEQLQALAPDNRTILGRVAFYHANQSEWEKSLSFIDQYFETRARETSLSLSLGLLKGQILKITGNMDDARKQLTRFQNQTDNPWYGIITRQLLKGPNEADLTKLAANSPAKLITLHTALGLDAEGNQNRETAARHYREALGTYLDSWNEYDLARARLIRFRTN
ncbi:MAG: trypsin-like peptidase domain-containing protein [Desulfobacterales bacterium]|nr:trypsin-like peptidase domain-containing protein [Desulfobacterales bacterium]